MISLFGFSCLYHSQDFFTELKDREREFGISDIQLGLTTLEEVFLNISQQAELENAAAEGSFATLTLNSGSSVKVSVIILPNSCSTLFLNRTKEKNSISDHSVVEFVDLSMITLQIPVGAKYIGIPGTESAENPRGVMVEVNWEQDDSGRLCISGHSEEMPIPPHVQLTATPTPTSGWGLRRRRKILGIVIDPAQINVENVQ